MLTAIVETCAQLQGVVGREVAVSDWLEVSQARINGFAEATEDRQWIHTDAARAEAESPYGTTIAHGFLTLSLLVPLMERSVTIRSVKLAVNYGLNRVRFPQAVPAGTRVRARVGLSALAAVAGGWQATWAVTVEGEGLTKPCCLAEWLVRYYE